MQENNYPIDGGNCPGEKGKLPNGVDVRMFDLKAGLDAHEIQYPEAVVATLPGGGEVYKTDIMFACMNGAPRHISKELHRLKEMSHFVLAPGQRIGEHTHVDDMEWWVITWIDAEGYYHIKVSFCPKGESHHWINDKGVSVNFTALKWNAPA